MSLLNEFMMILPQVAMTVGLLALVQGQENPLLSVPIMLNVSEGQETVRVCATLNNSSPTEVNIVAMLTTYNAVDLLSDSELTSKNVTFPPNSSDGAIECINIPITDSIHEGEETFTVVLTTTSPNVTLGNARTNITVMNNDVAPLMVTVNGSGGILTVGENHALTCQVTGGGTTTPTYRWFKDGALLSDRTSDTLSFSPVREISSAVYTCEGTRGDMTVMSPAGVSITAVLPAFSAVITPTGQNIEGQRYVLTCASSGDESLQSTSRHFRWDNGSTPGIHNGSTLVFDPLLCSDEGEYTCTTSFTSPYLIGRRAGSGTVTFTVNCIQPGQVNVSNLQVTTPTATSLTITWTVYGFPDRLEVMYSYTINRCSSPQGAPRTDTISDSSVRSHTLRNLNEDSSYTITVRAINTVNSTEATIMGDTSTTAPSGSPGPLSFSDVTLTSMTVQWTELPCSDRNGEITGYTVEYSSTTPPHTNTVTVSGSNNTRLVVGDLLPRTSYTFSVRAQGPAGTSDSATAAMTIATPTATTNAPTSAAPTPTMAATASVPRLPSSVQETSITSSSATIQWMLTDPYNPSQPETFTMPYGLTSGQLTMSTPGITASPTSRTYSIQLTSLEPATTYYYRIESSNMFETLFNQVRFFTTIESRSTEVVSLLARSASDDTLSISWDPPANPNGDILSYSVRVINLSDGSEVTVEREDLSTEFTLTGLVPGVPYNVSIAAVNRAGPGEFTVFIHFTRQLEPIMAPLNISVTRPSATVMVVSWIPLSYSKARGFISHYTVAYSPLTSGRKRQALDTMTQTVPGMDANTTRIGGLDANADYIVQVSATNGAGRSDGSSPILVEIKGTVTSDGGAVVGTVVGIVVVVILAVVVVTVMGVVIALLVVKSRKAKQLATPQGDAGYEKDEMYSEIQTPPNQASGGSNFTLSKCAAYGPVSTTQAPNRAEEGDQYEVIQHNSQV